MFGYPGPAYPGHGYPGTGYTGPGYVGIYKLMIILKDEITFAKNQGTRRSNNLNIRPLA